jgi:hypothetical protein
LGFCVFDNDNIRQIKTMRQRNPNCTMLLFPIFICLFSYGCMTPSESTEESSDWISNVAGVYSTQTGDLHLYVEGRFASDVGYGRAVIMIPLTKILAERRYASNSNAVQGAALVQGKDWVAIPRTAYHQGWTEDHLPMAGGRMRNIPVGLLPKNFPDKAAAEISNLRPVAGSQETVYVHRQWIYAQNNPYDNYFLYVSETPVEGERHYLAFTMASLTLKPMPKPVRAVAGAVATTAMLPLVLPTAPLTIPAGISFFELLNSMRD